MGLASAGRTRCFAGPPNAARRAPAAVITSPMARATRASTWCEPQRGRATQEIDYGRRDVAGYVFGAPELVEGPAGHGSGVHRAL
jgi:hypothetical protein